MKAIIVDDEHQAIRVLQKLLESYCDDVEVVAVATKADDARSMIEEFKPDLVFLDISMPGKSGIQMVSELTDFTGMIIFVTAHDQYVLQALRLSAVDYLLKPVHEDELVAAVAKARSQMTRSLDSGYVSVLKNNLNSDHKQLRISLPTSEGFIIRRVEEILYCEADNNYTVFIFSNESRHLVSKPLSYFDQVLTPYQFVRIHKSTLVQLQHIISYSKTDGGYVMMANHQRLEVSKRRRQSLLDALRGFLLH